MRNSALKKIVLLACVLALALALRAPLVGAHSRYFYHEDDAHHFNRTVEMAQRFDFNPGYFNKPALHFYLRMPVVWASAAWARLAGELSGLHEIQTRDSYGLAGYAFTASHPVVLAWSRWFSVAISLCIVALVFSLSLRLSLPTWGAFVAATLVAVSPEVLINSDIIGVDVPMALFCLLSTALGISCLSAKNPRRWLLLCGFVAGLAGATKYNAAPVAFVPFVVAFLRDRTIAGFAIALLAPALGYLCGAPYSLISFNDFWTGLSYEVWHYSVSGHEGHSASPGLGQAAFYLGWLASDGIGPIAAVFAAVGILLCVLRRNSERLVFLAFPIAYLVLMLAQKTNFSRNMVAIVPYAAILAAFGLYRASQVLHSEPLRLLVAALLSIAAVAVPLFTSTRIALREAIQPESRNVLRELIDGSGSNEEIAIAGNIQASPALWGRPGVVVFNSTSTPLASLVQQSITLVALPAADAAVVALPFAVEFTIPGSPIDKHSPKNPAITVLRVTDETLRTAQQVAPAQLALVTKSGSVAFECGEREERHCWLQARQTRLRFPVGTPRVTFQLMSPWPGQEISLTSMSGEALETIALSKPGEWISASITLPPGADSLLLSVKVIHAPSDQGLSTDSRRLGVAVRVG